MSLIMKKYFIISCINKYYICRNIGKPAWCNQTDRESINCVSKCGEPTLHDAQLLKTDWSASGPNLSASQSGRSTYFNVAALPCYSWCCTSSTWGRFPARTAALCRFRTQWRLVSQRWCLMLCCALFFAATLYKLAPSLRHRAHRMALTPPPPQCTRD
jgi:hypothetical protein